MTSGTDKDSDDHIGRSDANDVQRAIRERALYTIRRKPVRFWYSTPARLLLAVLMAIALVSLLTLGMDKFLRVFNHLVRIYITQPANTTAPPATTSESNDSGVIYVAPGDTPVPPRTGEPIEGPAK